MELELYEQLRKHINDGYSLKIPRTKELMEILQILFNPEQAEYALQLPLTTQGRISIGCGLCASFCTQEAITMEKVRDYVPAQTLAEVNERYEKERVW